MNLKRIREKFYDATARIGWIHLLAAVDHSDCQSDSLEEFFEETTASELHEIFPDLDMDDLEQYEGDAGGIGEYLERMGLLGFIVQIETPVMDNGTYHWGLYTSTVVYADTLDGAIAKGLRWVKSVRAKERRREKAAAKRGAA